MSDEDLTFDEIDRPPRNKRKLGEDMPWDHALQNALLATLDSGKAIRVSLVMFHSSPAKGRLWKQGIAVRHRVQGDWVAAWCERPVEPEKPYDDSEFTGELF